MTQKCPRQFSKSRLKFVDVMGQIEWSRKSRVNTTRIPRERERKRKSLKTTETLYIANHPTKVYQTFESHIERTLTFPF